MIASKKPRLVFDDGFDDREEAECRDRGYRSHVSVELSTGERYPVVFYDAVRLSQDLEDESAAGSPFVAEPGLIVLTEVTLDNMQAAVDRLASEGYFQSMASLGSESSAVDR